MKNTEFFINVGKLAEIIEIWQAPDRDEHERVLQRFHPFWTVWYPLRVKEKTGYQLTDGSGNQVAIYTTFEEAWNHEVTQKGFKETVYRLCNRLYQAHGSPVEWDNKGELADIARNLDFSFDRLLVDYVVSWAKEDIYKQNCILEAICQKLGTTLKAGDE